MRGETTNQDGFFIRIEFLGSHRLYL
jgi:hypothetical protein